MGATKLNIRHVNSIDAVDLVIDDFQVKSDHACSFSVNRPVEPGEMVLVKVSFKNACEAEAEEPAEAVLYRRRVVPLVTRVTRTMPTRAQRGTRIAARIESMTAEDRNFFFKKYFDRDGAEPFELELEGKHIRFAAN